MRILQRFAFDSESEKGKFYVYGLGQMLGLYDKAGYAVQKAMRYQA